MRKAYVAVVVFFVLLCLFVGEMQSPWNKGKVGIYSKETLKKMSEAKKGKRLSKEHKRKIGKAGKGRKVSEETRKKMSESGKGKVFSEEHKKRISDVKKGIKQHSKEARKRIGDAERGAKNHNWKGGKTFAKGYVYILKPEHPFATGGRYVSEHRLIMEKHLGRYLRPKEIVHHIDGNKANNRLKNLMLFSNNGEHTKFHFNQNPFRGFTLFLNSIIKTKLGGF